MKFDIAKRHPYIFGFAEAMVENDYTKKWAKKYGPSIRRKLKELDDKKK